MIFDTLNNRNTYDSLHAGVAKGLALVAELDFSKYDEGKHEVPNSDIFFLIQPYDTSKTETVGEAHRKYIDIQYMIEGTERVGVATLSPNSREVEAYPERDAWFYSDEQQYLTLHTGEFMVFYPHDIHAPSLVANGKSCTVKKCVVKVPV